MYSLSSSTLPVPPITPSPPQHIKHHVVSCLDCHQHSTSPFSSRQRLFSPIHILKPHRPSIIIRCASMQLDEPPPLQLEQSLEFSRAYWVNRSLIAWNVDVGDGCCYLYSSKTASLVVSNNDIEGDDVKIKLDPDSDMLPADVVEKFPHIGDYRVFKIPHGVDVKSLLKCQLAVALFDVDGKCKIFTGLQLPGVLDDLYSYSGPLGAIFSTNTVSLYLWAPTAQNVRAFLYRDPLGGNPLETLQLKEENGVWSANGPSSWEGCYYVYEVSVYHPSTLRIETCLANDPYARGLSSDWRRTLLVNLDSPNLQPQRWDDLADEKPTLSSLSDISIYELHIRDFSANDNTVTPEFRGGYLAFTSQDSAGVLHLKKLHNAGLTHVHLLPAFQFAGVDDEKVKWTHLDPSRLATLPPDSDEQQALVTDIQDNDGYNWGYNPVLWGVPKGSYASNPNGPCRTLEFRAMVQALNRIGLRVVLDVVYNHLQGNGPHDVNSVLDKVVPGYYLRRNSDGCIEHSTCMNNTASEHFMVERLILDDLLSWAVNYKVDGFRFDLMGHMMKRTMVKANSALRSLSKDKDGVDGSKIYIYGEGWDFGEVAKNGRGINASQFNLSGTGIGSFNDRIRDAVLGGSPFGNPLQQGFVTGLSFEPNGHDHGSKTVVDNMLTSSQDHIQVGMAANLRDFVLTSHHGKEVKGSEILTHDGLPVAYALCPTETTPVEISVDERCRVNHLASSIIALSQGIPFFHCGDDMLRSKSLDRDSYNSGDWFNRIDFSYESNNWGIGLPPKGKNENHWPLIKPRLADPSFKPHKSHILSSVDNFLNLLRIRYSSPLFRLGTANAIQGVILVRRFQKFSVAEGKPRSKKEERVRFYNTGPLCVHGLIVMSIEDGHKGMPGLTQLDPLYSYIVVAFNARPTEVLFTSTALRARSLELHPLQLISGDEVVKNSKYDASAGSFIVPPRTTSVFVEPRVPEA